MNTKLYTYKSKNVFMLLLLAGILFSMYSCQYETVPVGTSFVQNNWINISSSTWRRWAFLLLCIYWNEFWRDKMYNLVKCSICCGSGLVRKQKGFFSEQVTCQHCEGTGNTVSFKPLTPSLLTLILGDLKCLTLTN